MRQTAIRCTTWMAIGIVILCVPAGNAAPPANVFVSIEKSTMNPSLGESVALSVRLAKPGSLAVRVIDRDGFPVRTLVDDNDASEGLRQISWDGRDGEGRTVPDEAYSFRVDWFRGAERETYFPADIPSHLTSVDAEYYAAHTATIVYTLPVASRVHLQAGVASRNAKTGELDGPVMKTVVNREPRASGRIAEAWNGFDESGTVKVSDLRQFVLAVAVMPLPENSVITYGNRQRTFAESASTRRGASLFTQRRKESHHGGLSVLEDISPAMRIEPLNASWSEGRRAWIFSGRSLRLRVTLSGPSAATFAAQKGTLEQFVDGKQVARSNRPTRLPAIIEMRVPTSAGLCNVTLNWQSEFGAVAADTVRVEGGGR
jgi:hypothetical protein